MKLKNTAIAAALSLVSLGQPLIIGTSAALMLAVPNKAQAESAEFYVERGNTKYRAGNFSGAIVDYSKAIEINLKGAKAYTNRGVSKDELNDYYGAISDYNKAIEINSKNDYAYNNRGRLKYLLGDNKGACKDTKKAASLGNEESIRILSGSIGAKICGSSRN